MRARSRTDVEFETMIRVNTIRDVLAHRVTFLPRRDAATHCAICVPQMCGQERRRAFNGAPSPTRAVLFQKIVRGFRFAPTESRTGVPFSGGDAKRGQWVSMRRCAKRHIFSTGRASNFSAHAEFRVARRTCCASGGTGLVPDCRGRFADRGMSL